jgi:hypothetical protein
MFDPPVVLLDWGVEVAIRAHGEGRSKDALELGDGAMRCSVAVERDRLGSAVTADGLGAT